MRLSGMGRASELLLLPIRVLYEWTFSLVLVDVYARKHSSRHKVERLVYYIRYMAMWSDSEILDHIVVCLDKDRDREAKKNKMRSRVIDIIECIVFWFISLSQTHVYWSIASYSLSPFAYGSMGQLCIYLKWTDDAEAWSFHIYTIITSS